MEIVSSFSSKSLWWFKSHYRRQFDKQRKMLFVKNLTEVTVQSLEKMHSVTVQNEHVTAF